MVDRNKVDGRADAARPQFLDERIAADAQQIRAHADDVEVPRVRRPRPL
jgi:hypothetical protein